MKRKEKRLLMWGGLALLGYIVWQNSQKAQNAPPKTPVKPAASDPAPMAPAATAAVGNRYNPVI